MIMFKIAREKNNYTQKEVAEKVGLAKNSYQSIELGLRYPSLETLESLCEFFDFDFLEVVDHMYNDKKEKALELFYKLKKFR